MTTEREKIIGAAWTLGEALLTAVTKPLEAAAEKVAEPSHPSAGPSAEKPKVDSATIDRIYLVVQSSLAKSFPWLASAQQASAANEVVKELLAHGVLK